jgi:FlaA1/EpsC-like NDP-sugar epimerase
LKKLYRAYSLKLLLLSLDLVLVLLSLPAALFVRLDFYGFVIWLPWIRVNHFIVVAGCYFVSFLLFRTYRTILSLANLYTALRVGGACLLGAVASYTFVSHVFALPALPRATYLIQVLILVPLLIGYRFSWRIGDRLFAKKAHGARTLIYGAGEATNRFLPTMLRMREDMRIVGIVDDNPSKRGSEVQGVKVRGSGRDIARLVRKYGIEQVLLAMPSVTGSNLRKIVDELYDLNLKVRVLPAPEAYVKSSEGPTISDIRDLNIEDLLRRAPRSINKSAIESILKGRSVLVTGGGGSIGSELVRQIASMGPAKLIVNDASEFALYNISEEIKQKHPLLCFVSHLGNMSNIQVAKNLFEQHRIQAVFHACAYKHVPLVEENVCAAISNNLLSARNVFELANQHGCERVVLISSDKAVRPTNAMGATKRICELLALSYASRQSAEHKCAFAAVRFGNVLGSSGSVVPKFVEQIRSGGPVTITHPNITRFFMLIPEAVSLVLQAATESSSGEIFILNMGEPIKITDMAYDLIRLMGKRPEIDVKVTFTGLRPGEKLYEELQLETENIQSITEDFFKLVRVAEPASNFLDEVASMLACAETGNSSAAREMLFNIVRKYETSTPVNA